MRRFAAVSTTAGSRRQHHGRLEGARENLEASGQMRQHKSCPHASAHHPVRVPSPRWSRSKRACEEAIEAIAEDTGLTDPSRRAVLYSTYEFKKIRLMYFTPDYREWEDLALAGAPLPRWRT
jgi:hypothetical protein